MTAMNTTRYSMRTSEISVTFGVIFPHTGIVAFSFIHPHVSSNSAQSFPTAAPIFRSGMPWGHEKFISRASWFKVNVSGGMSFWSERPQDWSWCVFYQARQRDIDFLLSQQCHRWCPPFSKLQVLNMANGMNHALISHPFHDLNIPIGPTWIPWKTRGESMLF